MEDASPNWQEKGIFYGQTPMERKGDATQNLWMVSQSLISKKIDKNKTLTTGYVKVRVAAAISTQIFSSVYFCVPKHRPSQYLNYPSGATSSRQLAFKIPEWSRTVKLQCSFNTVFLKHIWSDTGHLLNQDPILSASKPRINTNLIPLEFQQTWVGSGELASDEDTEDFNLSMLRLRTGTLGVGTGELMELAEAERGQRWDSIKVRNLTRQNKNQVHSIRTGEKEEGEREKERLCVRNRTEKHHRKCTLQWVMDTDTTTTRLVLWKQQH